jgi:hypothetical protein
MKCGMSFIPLDDTQVSRVRISRYKTHEFITWEQQLRQLMQEGLEIVQIFEKRCNFYYSNFL